jgi:putative redox protein
MALIVKWDGGVRFVGENEDGSKATMEPGPAFGGSRKYPTPMELLVMALGGCTGMDVLFILKKMRVDLKKLEVSIETSRREKTPRYYENIKMTYVVSGDGITEDKVRRAVQLSNERYCSIGVMLQDKAKIEYDVVVSDL